jgi:tetratricopeptide (TPR) repeat protein
MIKRSVWLFISLFFCISIYAQDTKALQETFLEAEYFLLNEDYSDALAIYLKLYEKLPENSNIAYRIGVCYLNISEKKNLSIDYLETAVKNMSAKHKEGSITQVSAPYDALYNLGIAYRVNFLFDKAKETFEKYSFTLLPDDQKNLEFIKHEIIVCDLAKELINKPVTFTEENMGSLFNDEKPNFSPLISADGKSFVYMVSLKFYDAIMFSRLIDGKWSAPINILPDLQSDGEIFVSCLSADGKLLFLSKNDDYNSDIYSSSFDGNMWSKAIKLNKNINTKYWESLGFISEKGDQFVFASDKPGGYGGLDLYVSYKVNGDWGPAVNMGPVINTQYNEDRPFLINNGKTIFFNSQGHKNIGGYDIFRTDLISKGVWTEPENLGYPFNTPDDDFFFMPVGDGKSGYCSIYKTSGGFGKEDIYKITFK